MTAPVIDERVYRDVVGRFATGVTVVTFQNEYMTRGMTANAVSSLSLDPTLLLVCVAKRAMVHAQLEQTDAFAVNILADDQSELVLPGIDGVCGESESTAGRRAAVRDVHERDSGETQPRHERVGGAGVLAATERELDVSPLDPGILERQACGEQSHVLAGDAVEATEGVNADADNGDVQDRLL